MAGEGADGSVRHTMRISEVGCGPFAVGLLCGVLIPLGVFAAIVVEDKGADTWGGGALIVLIASAAAVVGLLPWAVWKTRPRRTVEVVDGAKPVVRIGPSREPLVTLPVEVQRMYSVGPPPPKSFVHAATIESFVALSQGGEAVVAFRHRRAVASLDETGALGTGWVRVASVPRQAGVPVYSVIPQKDSFDVLPLAGFARTVERLSRVASGEVAERGGRKPSARPAPVSADVTPVSRDVEMFGATPIDPRRARRDDMFLHFSRFGGLILAVVVLAYGCRGR